MVVQKVASPGILAMLKRERVMEASKPEVAKDRGRQANLQPEMGGEMERKTVNLTSLGDQATSAVVPQRSKPSYASLTQLRPPLTKSHGHDSGLRGKREEGKDNVIYNQPMHCELR